jgi:formylglycine-generating enzyme required for sulfatase activity
METGNHFKNGVNLQNLSSRVNRVGDTKLEMPKPETKPQHILLRIAGNVAVLALLLFTVCRASAQQRHPAEPEMVFVEGGTFTMGCTSEQGSDCEEDEKPAHSVTLSSFQIGKAAAQWNENFCLRPLPVWCKYRYTLLFVC